ncbi:MAG: ABC-2 family transporter protein [Thermaerobacter sp.]|nr:ABC-2 family transporter protein [Thermaerobacter sp.]
MAAWWNIYRILVRYSIRAERQYPWNFFFNLLFHVLMLTAELATVLLILARVGPIAGWSAKDIIFLFGLVTAEGGGFRIFAAELHDFDKYLVHGEFDAILIRPAPSLLSVITRSIDIGQAAMILQGLALLAWASWRLHLMAVDGWAVWLAMGLALVSGSVIWFAMVTALAALGFWTTRTDDLAPVILYGPETAAQYPLSIYPQAIRWLFFSVLPIGFGGYLPAAVILHKMAGSWMIVGSVAAAAASLAAALGLWSWGVRRYTSTGT